MHRPRVLGRVSLARGRGGGEEGEEKRVPGKAVNWGFLASGKKLVLYKTEGATNEKHRKT